MYALVFNIPRQIRSKDLRAFFYIAIQNNTFKIFHFKHRNDILKDLNSEKNVCCCFIEIKKDFKAFYNFYNAKNWIKNGKEIDKKCFILPILPKTMELVQKYSNDIKVDDICKYPELNPPNIMPQGNVGTPDKFFYDKIQQCKLPSSIIRKLGLSFQLPKEYGNVPFGYENMPLKYSSYSKIMRNMNIQQLDDFGNFIGKNKYSNDDDPSYSNTIRPLPNIQLEKLFEISTRCNSGNLSNVMEDKIKGQQQSDESEGEEDWERHCAFYNDVDKQERCKERLFEGEKEVVWEKGSSGLVFYTDAAFWHDLEEGKGNIFEEQCPDDWDLDMSIYENPKSGDKDAQDLLSIHIKDGGGIDCWAPEKYNKITRPNQNRGVFTTSRYSRDSYKSKSAFIDESFENNVVGGIGRKIIEKIGWKEGQGLGKDNKGISEPVPVEGKLTSAKIGLGYFDKVINRNHVVGSVDDNISLVNDAPYPLTIIERHHKYHPKHTISTVYDEPPSPPSDPFQLAMQSLPPTHIKSRR